MLLEVKWEFRSLFLFDTVILGFTDAVDMRSDRVDVILDIVDLMS